MNRVEGASFTICPHLSPALDPATCPLRRCASPSPLPGAHAGDLPSPTTGCPTILPRCQIDRYPILLRYSSRASADLRGRQPSLSAAHPTRRSSLAMVYHSSFTDNDGITKACGCPLLPLKTHIKGPAPASDSDKADIVDEAITFFRANVFFKNFHVKSPADKLLIYLTSYINIALKRLEGCRTLAVGTKAIINLGLEKVPVPGEPGFPFPGLFALPQSQEEAELLRNYLKQIREETSGRLLNCAYRTNGTPNKWWLAFAKRKFMNIVIL